jgi:lysophospholipase L1-like esterase
MTAVPRWGLVSVLSAASLCAGHAHAAPRVPTHVACVGDSITAGAGASSPTMSYPSNLQGLFGASVQVKNFGHSGTTMLANGDLPYETQAEYPAATSFVAGAGANAVVDVVIMLGTNDSKPMNWAPAGKPKNDQQYLTDYRAMVDHFLALTPKPVVFLALPLATGANPCCAISGTVIHDEVIPLIKQLAQEKHLPTIDLNTPTTNHNEYFVDGVHPNDAAYKIVAQIFHDGLLQDPSGGGGGGAGGGGAGGASGNAAPRAARALRAAEPAERAESLAVARARAQRAPALRAARVPLAPQAPAGSDWARAAASPLPARAKPVPG